MLQNKNETRYFLTCTVSPIDVIICCIWVLATAGRDKPKHLVCKERQVCSFFCDMESFCWATHVQVWELGGQALHGRRRCDFKGFCGDAAFASLLGKEGVPVGLHLFQPLYEVVVRHLHLFDLVQGCAQLPDNNITHAVLVTFIKLDDHPNWICDILYCVHCNDCQSVTCGLPLVVWNKIT